MERVRELMGKLEENRTKLREADVKRAYDSVQESARRSYDAEWKVNGTDGMPSRSVFHDRRRLPLSSGSPGAPRPTLQF